MLTVTVELLHGTIRAGSADDLAVTGENDEGDWPPSPARLFAALVAADGTRDRCRVTTGAELVPLECAAPPRILADVRENVCLTPLEARYVVTDATVGNTVQNYPARAATLVRPAPRLAPRTPRIAYVWDDLTLSASDLAALRSRAARIGYLGCSDSPARVLIHDGPPGDGEPTGEWLPDPEGEATVPVPFPGATAVLDRMFDDFTTGIPNHRSWYRTEVVGYRSPDQALSGTPIQPWPRNFWLRLDAPLPARRALDLAEALKSATLCAYRDMHGVTDDEMPFILHGHVPDGASGYQSGYQVVQWVPLPDVGGDYSDGRIHGAIVMLPAETGLDVVQRIGTALSNVHTLHLRGGRRVEIALGPDERGRGSVAPKRWSGSARLWVSALPVVQERRSKNGVGLDEVTLWCRHAGFPAPEWATVSPIPMLPGSQTLAPSEVFRQGHGERRPYRHVSVLFDRPVTGPMVLGRGRQFGMGLMAPPLWTGDR